MLLAGACRHDVVPSCCLLAVHCCRLYRCWCCCCCCCCVPPASLGSVPFLPAYSAPLLSCWKLRMLPLAFVGWRLGRSKLHLFLCEACSFLFLSLLVFLPPSSSCCLKLGIWFFACSLCLLILACLCKLCHVSYLSWTHADQCQHIFGRKHPSRDVIFSGQNFGQKCQKLSLYMTSSNLQKKHFWHHVM